jgi:hypothetical protein
VLQEFEHEKLTVREREVWCSPVIREFEFVFLTVENPNRNGRRERISSSEATTYQWKSLVLCLVVKKDNVPSRTQHIDQLEKHLTDPQKCANSVDLSATIISYYGPTAR